MKKSGKQFWDKNFYIGYVEITVRELVFSLIIVAIMLLSGLKIKSAIDRRHIDKVYEYQTALQIDNEPETFSYNIKTNVGRALVYGDAKIVDPVPCFEMGGSYGKVEKEEEHYNMHTRIVTYTDSNGKSHTRTETYWSWDHYDSWYDRATTVNFCGSNFNFNELEFGYMEHIDTVNFAHHKRYNYYGSPTETTMTIFTKLADNTINDSKVYENKTIDEVMKKVNSNPWSVVFTVVWIIFTLGLLCGFYYLDNWWLK